MVNISIKPTWTSMKIHASLLFQQGRKQKKTVCLLWRDIHKYLYMQNCNAACDKWSNMTWSDYKALVHYSESGFASAFYRPAIVFQTLQKQRKILPTF